MVNTAVNEKEEEEEEEEEVQKRQIKSSFPKGGLMLT